MNAKHRRPRLCTICNQSFHMNAEQIKRHAELCKSGKGIELPSLVIAQNMPQSKSQLQRQDPNEKVWNRIAREVMIGKR